ncbi:uncharacterized protein LOC115224031 isoform X2 [Octopus sinensis]|uniref:Uncharacterized protein LOC115224031 isoform X2 n=1 Tax=Octopus sinensis TaxID=2607531 RepID=A0A7E6FPZ2_9MOLL|nr:uncharacterized protein LOC115224031 isoform X2 [Octopus sinensis]
MSCSAHNSCCRFNLSQPSLKDCLRSFTKHEVSAERFRNTLTSSSLSEPHLDVNATLINSRMSHGNKAVDSEILRSGIAQLTGATDIDGRCVVTFPVASVNLLDSFTSNRLAHLLEYYCSLMLPVDQVKGFSILICLQHATHPGIQMWLQAMESVQKTTSDSINVVYLIKPKMKDNSRLLKKQLGLKAKYSSAVSVLFKVVWLEKIKEVYSYIDPSQLTEDYGGFLKYSHKAWYLYQMTVGDLLTKSHQLEKKIPTAKDQLQLLTEYDIKGRDSAELKSLVQQLEEKFHGIMKNLNMETIIDKCKNTIASMEHPETDSVLSQISSSILVSSKAELLRLHNYFLQSKQSMSRIWEVLNDQIQRILQIEQCQEDATKLCDEIKKYEELMDEHVKPCRSQAEVEACFNHFQSSLYTPAKEIMEKATFILQTIQSCKSDDRPQFTSEFLSQFTYCVKTFANRLEDIHHQYGDMQQFFLVLRKCIAWYQKVLMFLPMSLRRKLKRIRKTAATYTDSSSESISSLSSASSSQWNNKLIPIPQNWAQIVSNIHSHYPSPKKEHIMILNELAPKGIGSEIQAKSSLLFFRIQVLLKLLQKSIFRGYELNLALKWKAALMKDKDDIVNDVAWRKSSEFSEKHPTVIPKTESSPNQKSSVDTPINGVTEPEIIKTEVIKPNISKTNAFAQDVSKIDVTASDISQKNVSASALPKPEVIVSDVGSRDVKTQREKGSSDPPDYKTVVQTMYPTSDGDEEYFVSLSFSSEVDSSSAASQDEDTPDLSPRFTEILPPVKHFPLHQTLNAKSFRPKSRTKKNNVLPNNLKKSKKFVSMPSSLANGFDTNNDSLHSADSASNLCYSSNSSIKRQIFHDAIVKQIREVTLSNIPADSKIDIVSSLLNKHQPNSSSMSSSSSHRSRKTWHQNTLSSDISSDEDCNLNGREPLPNMTLHYRSLPRVYQNPSNSNMLSSVTGNRAKPKRMKFPKTKLINDGNIMLRKQYSKSLMNLQSYNDDDLADDTAPLLQNSNTETSLNAIEEELNQVTLQETRAAKSCDFPGNERQMLLSSSPRDNSDYINQWINCSCSPTGTDLTDDLAPSNSLSDTGYTSNRVQNESSDEYEEFDSILVELQQDQVQSTLERTEKILLEQEQLLNSELETETDQDFEPDELLGQQSDSASVAKSESQDFDNFI